MELPKFLISKFNGREFVIHTGTPHFITEVERNDGGTISIEGRWMEQIPNPDVMQIAKLMRECGDWYSKENNGSQ